MALSGMYVLQGVVPSEIAAAPFDVKVIDIYNDAGRPFTPTEVSQMGGGPSGALLLGYFSIGEAEVYRDYFRTIPTSIIGPENPDWDGNYQVAYWTQEWRAVATAYIDRVIAAGFDGVYFDVVDEYQQSWAKANAPGGAAGAEQAMADLVAYLADYAQAKVPTFKVWANNAEELLSNQTYLSSIDGMFKENLYYTDSGNRQPLDETEWSLDLLSPMLDAGKPVIAIEYVSDATKVADVRAKAAADGLGYYTADLDLNGVSYTGVVNPGTPVPVPDPVPVADLVLNGTLANDALAGQAGNDKLYGKAGNDSLSGNAGTDWLDGGKGKDQLSGGSGDDTFVFRASGSLNSDRILDFAPTVDKVALDHLVFTKIGQLGSLTAAAYHEGTRAHDASDRIIYNQVTGTIYYDPDGTGRSRMVEVALVSPGTDLSHTDFFVI